MDSYSDNTYICKICNETVSEKKHFWKEHKISEAKYFEEHDPKHDLLTGEIIPFKSYGSYLQTDFVKRLNIKRYFEKSDQQTVIDYLQNWLEQRKSLKNIVFPPCQFETRAFMFPAISYIIQNLGVKTYKQICKNVGLVENFNYCKKLFTSSKKNTFVVDSREQSILKFDDFEVKKLDVGDYTIDGSSVFIERKSLVDFLGTMSQGHERFNNEIQRAVVSNKYVVVLIEEKYSNLLSYPYLPHTKRVKAEPSFIHHRVREMIQKYPFNIQFLAVNGRKEASRVIQKIFTLTNEVQHTDLQYFYDIKEL